MPRAKVPFFLSQDLAVLEAESDVDANFTIDEFTLEPQPPRFILALNGGLGQVKAQLQCAYGLRIMTVGVTSKDESLWLPDPEMRHPLLNPRHLARKWRPANECAMPGSTVRTRRARWNLHGESKVVTFFAKDYPRLQKEWEVTLEEASASEAR